MEKLSFFDWSDDPFEQRDRASERPDEVRELAGWLDERREQCESLRRRIGPNVEEVLSQEEIDELQALGYVDEQ